MPLTYLKHKKIKLRDSDYDETWLQGIIADDPLILGLGEVELLERERRQRHGRLDILLSNPDKNQRYAVEIQLGKCDPSHIIRCIEYWDIERKRYPNYDHCAVLVAEEVTARYLNVLQLFNGHIPMIILQLDVLKIDNNIVLDFVKVMDRFELRADDISEIQSVQASTRKDWEKKTSNECLKCIDEILDFIKIKVKHIDLKYNKYYIGLSDSGRVNNFIAFKPRKKYFQLHANLDPALSEDWVQKFEEVGIASIVVKDGRRIHLTSLTPNQINENKVLLDEFITHSISFYLDNN